MNRYTFCFTKKELKEFSIRAVLEQYRRRGRIWVILLLLCVLEAFISPAFSVVILFLFAAALGVDMFQHLPLPGKGTFPGKTDSVGGGRPAEKQCGAARGNTLQPASIL